MPGNQCVASYHPNMYPYSLLLYHSNGDRPPYGAHTDHTHIDGDGLSFDISLGGRIGKGTKQRPSENGHLEQRTRTVKCRYPSPMS